MTQRTKPMRILIVDDNPAIHEDFRKILSPEQPEQGVSLDAMEEQIFGGVSGRAARQRFRLASAHQGQEALQRVLEAAKEGDPYSMAFVDVRMPPGWDGVQTIKEIWKYTPDLQVVICTAYSDYSWQRMIDAFGETDSLVVLKKPFDNVEVLQLAHALTRKWMLNRELQGRFEKLGQELAQTGGQLEKEIEGRAQAEERFNLAFHASPVPFCILSLSASKIVDANASFLTLLGVTREECIGRGTAELRFFEDPKEEAEAIGRLREKKSLRNHAMSLRTRSGETRATLVFGEALDLRPEACGLLIVLDETERRKLEQQLQQAQKMEAVGQLAAGLAHDFNNLLTIIQGNASWRLDTGTDPDTDLALREIQAASQRCATLTRQLLAFSRKQHMRPRPMDLNVLLKDYSQTLQRALGAHVALKLDLGENLPLVLADPSQLEQVLINLMLNSREAMPKGGSVTIGTRILLVDDAYCRKNAEARPGQFIRWSVQDTGCGIDPANLGRIFEPFYSTKDPAFGGGLGLPMVHGIIKQHDGWIELESTPGVGTTFHMHLAVVESKVSNQASVPTERTQNGCTVLVVEDEPMLRMLLRRVLERNGIKVLMAGDGAEALRCWQEHQSSVDALVTDLVMPGGMSGQLLAGQLKQQKPGLKLIYMSGYNPDHDADGKRPLEGRFLAKPFAPEELMDALRQVMSEK